MEQYCSATGVVRLTKRYLAANDTPSVLQDTDFECKDVFAAAAKGDEAAQEIAAIALSIRWVKAIDRALDRLTAQSPNVWDIARSYYIAGSELPVRRRIAQLCTHLNIERAAFNQYRRCIVHSVYLQALYEHLLTPDEAGIRELMTT